MTTNSENESFIKLPTSVFSSIACEKCVSLAVARIQAVYKDHAETLVRSISFAAKDPKRKEASPSGEEICLVRAAVDQRKVRKWNASKRPLKKARFKWFSCLVAKKRRNSVTTSCRRLFRHKPTVEGLATGKRREGEVLFRLGIKIIENLKKILVALC